MKLKAKAQQSFSYSYNRKFKSCVNQKKDFRFFFLTHQVQTNRSISDSDRKYTSKIWQCLKRVSDGRTPPPQSY